MTKRRFTVESAGGAVLPRVVSERFRLRSRNGAAGMLNATTCTIAGLILFYAATAPASGQAVINSDYKSAGASTLQSDQDGNLVGSPQFFSADSFDDGLDSSGSAATDYNDMGFVATASSNWNHAYDPSDPGLGNAFSAVYMSGLAASDSTSEGQWWDVNSGFGSSVVYFSVASDTAWTFAADIVGTTSGFGSVAYTFLLFSEDGSTEYGFVDNFASGGGSINESLNIGGILPAGNYFFGVGIGAFQEYQFTPGGGSASIELTNGAFTIPEPGSVALLAIGSLALRRRRG